MVYPILLFCFSALTFNVISGILLECKQNRTSDKVEPFPYINEVQLKDDYQITIRYTNWMNTKTAKFVEIYQNGTFVARKADRTAEYSLYRAFNESIIYNRTVDSAYDCHKSLNEEEENIYELSPLLVAFLGVKGDNFSSILHSVVSNLLYTKTTERTANVTAGIETVGWLGCVDTFGDNNLTIQVNVYFSAEHSHLPYNVAFKNPQIYSIHIHSYNATGLDVQIVEHISFDVVTLDNVDKRFVDGFPRGVFCKNMTKAEFPHKLPARFKAHIRYLDSSSKFVDNVEILYDAEEYLFTVASNFKQDHDLPFIGKSTFEKDALIVHDFKFGFQYVLNKSGTLCYAVEPIDAKMGDVIVDSEGKLYLVDPFQVLFNTTESEFYYAGKITDQFGMDLHSYVSKRDVALDGSAVVLEVLSFESDWTVDGFNSTLHSVIEYHINQTGSILHQTSMHIDWFENNEKLHASWLKNPAHACFRIYDNQEYFFVEIKNATVSDLVKIGMERVGNALIEKIAHLTNTSVLRFGDFMLTTMHNSLLACFRVGEKTNKTPAKTAYLLNELSVEEIRQSLNNTFLNSTSEITFDILDDGDKHFVVSMNRFGLLSIRDLPPPPNFVGYSGTAMFVLALFMFIFGALLVIGGYVFYVKRRSIQGIAYQVFE